MKHIMLLSGGFDSTLGLTMLVKEYGVENVEAIFFNIGQRNYEPEHKSVTYFTEKFGVPLHEIELPVLRTSKREKPCRNPLMILKAVNYICSKYEDEEFTIYTMDEWCHTDDYKYGYPHRDFNVSCDVGDYKGLMSQLVEGETQHRGHFEMPVKGKSLLSMRPWIKKYNYTLDDLYHSVSCYNGNGCVDKVPEQRCYACKKRKYLEDVVFKTDVATEFPWE